VQFGSHSFYKCKLGTTHAVLYTVEMILVLFTESSKTTNS